MNIDVLLQQNVTKKHLGLKGLHLNYSGTIQLAKNIITKLRNLFLYGNELSISLEQNSEAKDDGLPHIPPGSTVHHKKNSKKGLTIASINVNSLTAKIDEIRLQEG